MNKRQKREEHDLADLISRHRKDRENLAQTHGEMMASLLETCERQRLEQERRHNLEWFKHRKQHGHELGRAGLAALEMGHA